MAVEQVEIQPSGAIRATIRPPGSKSITNRALICAALADGQSVLRGALTSEDTEVMTDALRQLGVSIQVSHTAGREWIVNGKGGQWPSGDHDLYIANSGTTMRFLAAALTAGDGVYRLDGTARMRERPIGDLLEALGQLGDETASERDNACPPVVIRGRGITGGRAKIAGDISSQFLSGLLMAAPYARNDVQLDVDGQLVSQPYVLMTIGVMEAFGVTVQRSELRQFRLAAGQTYRPTAYDIEPDASAASYFWAAAAITQGDVTVEGLTRGALQGDVAFCECLQQMGCRVDYHPHGVRVRGGALRGANFNMNAISDTVQTLAAVALFAEGPTTITGVAHIRHKETDRIGDLACELRKFGAHVDEREDGLRIVPGPLRGAAIDTYDDHRMAMSLALVGLRVASVVIRDPECTRKTYPDFFKDLAALY